MSELKATTAQEIVQNEKDCDYMDELFGGVKMPPTQVYLKSEADKVIAHNKYKRCLAMADMNWWQANRYSAAEMVERIRGNFEEAMQCSKLEKKIFKTIQ